MDCGAEALQSSDTCWGSQALFVAAALPNLRNIGRNPVAPVRKLRIPGGSIARGKRTEWGTCKPGSALLSNGTMAIFFEGRTFTPIETKPFREERVLLWGV